MGIKNLLTFLSQFPNIIEEKDINSYYGKKIAIDISLLLYQIIISTRKSGSDIINNNGIIITHLVGLFNKTIMLLEKGIIPIYVFDGKPSSLKNNTLLKRKNNRSNALIKYNTCDNINDKIKYFKRSTSISKNQFEQCKELLKFMGISYIESSEEADIELANLCKNNIVYGVYTEDMDILTLGSPKLIKNLFSLKKKPIEFNLEIILNELKLNYNEFIELCILFGCDYCKRITNINSTELYNIYIEEKNILKTINKLHNLGYYVKNNNDYNIIKNYFMNHDNIFDYNSITLNKPDYYNLYDLLINKYGFKKEKIINKFNKLKYLLN